MRVALEARAKHRGITLDQAKDQRAGTYLGYLAMLGKSDGLSSAQYAAAIHFLAVREEYLRSLKAPTGFAKCEALGSAGDSITEGYEAWCKRVRDIYDQAMKALGEVKREHAIDEQELRLAFHSVLLDGEARPELLGALRYLCNALVRHFGEA